MLQGDLVQVKTAVKFLSEGEKALQMVWNVGVDL